jgi:predicted membrane protein
MGYSSKGFSSEDFIDATTILGGIHKNILSKNFKGGDITIFMGGAEINLSQADIQGTASLDITQIMGGTKIIVPPHWEVRSQLTSVFGNIEDKRTNIGNADPNKVLIIDGSSVFGGIEIRNY